MIFYGLVVRLRLRFGEPTERSQMSRGALVKVVGKVRPAEEPWLAPLSGKPCVAFHARAEGSHRSLNAFRVDALDRAHDFWLDCDDGPVWVRPEGWVRTLAPSQLYHRDQPEAWRAYEDFSKRHGRHYREELGGFAEGRPFLESRIEVGARVAVVGEVGEPHRPDGRQRGGYRDRSVAPSVGPEAKGAGQLWISTHEAHFG